MSENEPNTLTDEVIFRDPETIKYERKLKRTRLSVVVLLVVVAINTVAALFLGQVVKAPEYSNGSSLVSAAIASEKINSMTSTTVYQQQVVNGWAARDLLEAIGNQNATMIDQNADLLRVGAFLLFNILFTLGAICVALIRIGLLRVDQSEHANRI